jgi:hypothetical protein
LQIDKFVIIKGLMMPGFIPVSFLSPKERNYHKNTTHAGSLKKRLGPGNIADHFTRYGNSDQDSISLVA